MRAMINVKVPAKKDGGYLTATEIRDVFKKMGLQPTDMPTGEESPRLEAERHDYFRERAAPIIHKIPDGGDKDEDGKKVRKDRTIKNLIYASDLAKSNTIFMVTAHTEGSIRFRLLNEKIEDLQEGCEDLVHLFMTHGRRHLTDLFGTIYPLEVDGKIRILEHGLEESTISGTVIHTKWKALRQFAPKETFLAIIAGVLSIPLIWLSITGFGCGTPLGLQLDRLSTAMFTAFVVSAISLIHPWRRLTPPVRWSVSYEFGP